MSKKKKNVDAYTYPKPKEEEKDFIPEFICLAGISCSGKEAFAKDILANKVDRNGKKYFLIEPGAVRRELTGDYYDNSRNVEVSVAINRRVKELLKLKTSVIFLDDHNIQMKFRRAILNAIKKITCTKTIYIFTTPFSVCFEKFKYSERKEFDKCPPIEALQRQLRSFEIPYVEEGWMQIEFVDKDGKVMEDFNKFPTFAPEDIVKSPLFQKQIGFNQRNKYQLYTLDEHSIKTAEQVKLLNPAYKLLHDEELVKLGFTEDELFNRFNHDKKILQRVAYLHDYGKLFTGRPKNDGTRDYKYFNHHNLGAFELMVCMSMLGLDNKIDILDFLFYVNYHMWPYFVSNDTNAEKKWRKYFGQWKYEMIQIFESCNFIGSGVPQPRFGVN